MPCIFAELILTAFRYELGVAAVEWVEVIPPLIENTKNGGKNLSTSAVKTICVLHLFELLAQQKGDVNAINVLCK